MDDKTNCKSLESDQEIKKAELNRSEENILDLIHNNFKDRSEEWHSQYYGKERDHVRSVTKLTLAFPKIECKILLET